MKLSAFKQHLKEVNELNFFSPTGEAIPKHFHITEVGQVSKNFIDCGGTIRKENTISMQLWESIDTWHRLTPTKLLQIVELSESKLGISDEEVEIEYQGNTIGRYHVTFRNNEFHLVATKTACLAEELCGVPAFEKTKLELGTKCTPGGGCC